MLRVDIAGFKLSSENCPKRTSFPDGEPEHVLLSTFVGLVRPSNHLVNIRKADMSLQRRAEFLLEGNLNDVSVSVRTHAGTEPGWYTRLPAEPSVYEKFLDGCVSSHIGKMLPRNFSQLVVEGRGVLLPAREHPRPARIEINLCSHVADTGYRAHTYLTTFARALAIGLSEYDANYARLSELYHLLQSEKDEAASAQREADIAAEVENAKRRKKAKAT